MAEADPNADPAGDEEEDSEEEGTPWTPPTKEEWEKTQRTAATRKRERDEARREAAAAKEAAGKTTAPAAEDKTAKTEARVKRQAGITALVSEGLSRDQAKELVGMLKLGELDEDGDVEGLDDSVADLKAKFPALFTTAPGKKTPAKVTTTDGGVKPSTKTPTDRTSEKLMRAAGLLV